MQPVLGRTLIKDIKGERMPGKTLYFCVYIARLLGPCYGSLVLRRRITTDSGKGGGEGKEETIALIKMTF